MLIKLNRKAQSTLEFAVLIAVVVAALLSMSVYFMRAISGRMRASSDDIGEQYEPKHTTSSFTTGLHSETKQEAYTDFDNVETRIIDGEEITIYPVIQQDDTILERTTKQGEENVGAF